LPVVEEIPQEARERLTEADVFAKYGLVDKAVRHLEEVLESYPGFHEAREQLVKILEEEGETGRAARVAGPLLTHYEATGNERGAAWIRSLVPAAGTAPPEAEGEEELLDEDEDVLLLDVDEVLADSGEYPVLEETPVTEEALALEEPTVSGGAPTVLEGELLFEEETGGRVTTGTGQRVDESLVEEIIFSELGDLVDMGRERTGTGGGTGRPEPPAAPAFGELAGETETAPPAGAPEIPGASMEAEAGELVEITEVVGGPPPSELEQLDFFIAQELYEDAARVLADLEASYPEDPDLAQRRLTLKEKGVILVEPETPAEEPGEELFAEEEEYIDLASELEKELAEEEAMVEEATGQGKDEALLEEVFREFQRGVAEQLSEEDSDTHFNLGIAYKEMGLLTEAIGEFQIASRDPAFRLEACSMIGVCYTEQGLHQEAVSWYRRALEVEGLSAEARMAILYDLASALEASGDRGEASQVFAQVAGMDPGYRDVADRVAGLQQQRQAN